MKNESERKSHGLEDDLKRAQQELNTMEKELNTMKKYVNKHEFVQDERDLKLERELTKKEGQISVLKAELEQSIDRNSQRFLDLKNGFKIKERELYEELSRVKEQYSKNNDSVAREFQRKFVEKETECNNLMRRLQKLEIDFGKEQQLSFSKLEKLESEREYWRKKLEHEQNSQRGKIDEMKNSKDREISVLEAELEQSIDRNSQRFLDLKNGFEIKEKELFEELSRVKEQYSKNNDSVVREFQRKFVEKETECNNLTRSLQKLEKDFGKEQQLSFSKLEKLESDKEYWIKKLEHEQNSQRGKIDEMKNSKDREISVLKAELEQSIDRNSQRFLDLKNGFEIKERELFEELSRVKEQYSKNNDSVVREFQRKFVEKETECNNLTRSLQKLEKDFGKEQQLSFSKLEKLESEREYWRKKLEHEQNSQRGKIDEMKNSKDREISVLKAELEQSIDRNSQRFLDLKNGFEIKERELFEELSRVKEQYSKNNDSVVREFQRKFVEKETECNNLTRSLQKLEKDFGKEQQLSFSKLEKLESDKEYWIKKLEHEQNSQRGKIDEMKNSKDREISDLRTRMLNIEQKINEKIRHLKDESEKIRTTSDSQVQKLSNQLRENAFKFSQEKQLVSQKLEKTSDDLARTKDQPSSVKIHFGKEELIIKEDNKQSHFAEIDELKTQFSNEKSDFLRKVQLADEKLSTQLKEFDALKQEPGKLSELEKENKSLKAERRPQSGEKYLKCPTFCPTHILPISNLLAKNE